MLILPRKLNRNEKDSHRIFLDVYESTQDTSRLVKWGFTLAEVLITLGVIGVVAAMTMPTLINKYRERQFVSGLQKAISTMENAYKLAFHENGESDDFGYIAPEYVPLPPEEGTGVYNKNGSYNSDKLFQALSKYLNIAKDCGINAEKEGCFSETIYSPFRENTWNLVAMQGHSRRFFILKDGTSIGVTGGGNTYIDVNGLKAPNTLGIDVFQVRLKNGRVSYYDDGADGTVKCYTDEFTCTSWVIRNLNMDYLHCKDLNWKTKTKCN